MVLENLGDEKCGHMVGFDSLLDRYEMGLIIEPINYCPYAIIPTC